ncbi:ClbS/DfsB family four-helix bundle protein [Demequina pelophila]|uniref:ClbS/DfsB family four-helix bundle protein n=1 Tax=Demequina pelophila TaxID=1638984 RepID=UPI0007860F6F|nr:ClbS/DfsB family four-helix bundle protein [Demequina pelophila]
MAASDRLATEGHAALVRLLARTDASSTWYLGVSYRNRRVTDVLSHLHAWHVLFHGWMLQHRAGNVPEYPAPGHSWDELEMLNDQLYEAHRDLDYAQARERLTASHSRTIEIVRGIDDAVLEDPAAMPWTRGRPLAEVAHECLAGHYAWAEGVLDDAGVPGAPSA